MVRKRGKRGHTSREWLDLERRREKARRERQVANDAILLRRFTPSETIKMMMDLSDICVGLGEGTKK